MNTESLLAKLDGVHKNGKGYTARCPAHDDRHNSLSINESEGKLLLHCHTGCQIDDLLKSLNLETKDLFLNGNGSKPDKQAKEHVWDITDSSGETITQHHRIDSEENGERNKSVWWERNGKNNLNGFKTKDLPLYGLKWLLEEPDGPERDIFACEGEPAADALHDAGYLALATVTGANGCPSEDSLIPLLGRNGRIILWPDNDEAGLSHMNRIAERLREMGVTCYRFDWPDAPPKGDAADLMANRKAYSLLSILISKNTHEYKGDNDFSIAKGDKKGTAHSCPPAISGCPLLSDQIRDWVEGATGWFETRELDSELGITTSKDKQHRKKILQRLREKGVIESHPRINKQFRYINTKATSLNFKTATRAGALPLKWPLGIEQYVNLFPGNIAVVAGSPNAGKTALLLNFIYLNRDKFPVYYFCSEMGGLVQQKRTHS